MCALFVQKYHDSDTIGYPESRTRAPIIPERLSYQNAYRSMTQAQKDKMEANRRAAQAKLLASKRAKVAPP